MKFPAWFANFLLANTSNDSVLFPYFTLSLKVQFQTPAWNWPVCPAGKTCRSPFPPECKPPTCRPRTSAAWRQSIPRWGRKGGWPVVRRHGCCQTAARQSSVRCSGRSRCCAAQDACRRLFLPQGLCSRCLWGVFAPLFLWFLCKPVLVGLRVFPFVHHIPCCCRFSHKAAICPMNSSSDGCLSSTNTIISSNASFDCPSKCRAVCIRP